MKAIVITLTIFLSLIFPTTSFAYDIEDGGEGGGAGQVVNETPPPTFSDNVEFFNQEGFKLKTDDGGLNPDLWTLNGIISTFLPYILSFAGVILLFMLISGGFTMLTAVGNPEAADKGKQQITAAFLGFILLFVSYWIIQILEIVLGINILGS